MGLPIIGSGFWARSLGQVWPKPVCRDQWSLLGSIADVSHPAGGGQSRRRGGLAPGL